MVNLIVVVLWCLVIVFGVGLVDFFLFEGVVDVVFFVMVIFVYFILVIKSLDGKCELKIFGLVDFVVCFEWYELVI